MKILIKNIIILIILVILIYKNHKTKIAALQTNKRSKLALKKCTFNYFLNYF